MISLLLLKTACRLHLLSLVRSCHTLPLLYPSPPHSMYTVGAKSRIIGTSPVQMEKKNEHEPNRSVHCCSSVEVLDSLCHFYRSIVMSRFNHYHCEHVQSPSPNNLSAQYIHCVWFSRLCNVVRCAPTQPPRHQARPTHFSFPYPPLIACEKSRNHSPQPSG